MTYQLVQQWQEKAVPVAQNLLDHYRLSRAR